MSQTVIIGSGIIGLSTAYYLSQSPKVKADEIHLVDSSRELFHCASGFAGGFLAADWFSTPVSSLGALSFKLHRDLAAEHNGKEKWGYSRSTGTSFSQGPPDPKEEPKSNGMDWLRDGTSRANAAPYEFQQGEEPSWLTRNKGSTLDVMTQNDTVAQVDPKRLCQFLLEQCLERGVQLHQPAVVENVTKDMRDCLASVRIVSDNGMETDIPCSRLIITAGPWSARVAKKLFPKANIPISALAGHSLLVKSPRWHTQLEEKGCHAVFATDTLGFAPEIFSRMGGDIYIAGLNTTEYELPERASDVETREDAIATLKQVAAQMLGLPGGEDDLVIAREGLCFRPVSNNGRPIISRIADSKLGMLTRPGAEGGVFLAAGHGPWGISQSLGTGLVLSELVQNLPTSANIDGLKLR